MFVIHIEMSPIHIREETILNIIEILRHLRFCHILSLRQIAESTFQEVPRKICLSCQILRRFLNDLLRDMKKCRNTCCMFFIRILTFFILICSDLTRIIICGQLIHSLCICIRVLEAYGEDECCYRTRNVLITFRFTILFQSINNELHDSLPTKQTIHLQDLIIDHRRCIVLCRIKHGFDKRIVKEKFKHDSLCILCRIDSPLIIVEKIYERFKGKFSSSSHL